MSKLTKQAVLAAIGAASAGTFTDKGIEFLKKRGNGAQGELAARVYAGLKSGKLSAGIPTNLQKEVKEAYGLSTLNDAQVAVIILGRPPRGSEKVHEASKVPTPEQKVVAGKLATKVMKGEIYKNHLRKKKVVTETAPATTAKEGTGQKVATK